MRRRYEEPTGPRERDTLELIRTPSDGVWWQAKDGMRIRLAGIEHGDHEPERERLSLLAVLIAIVVAGGRARV